MNSSLMICYYLRDKMNDLGSVKNLSGSADIPKLFFIKEMLPT